MIRFLGILSVILFWAVFLTLFPVIAVTGMAVFLLSISWAISSLVYEFVTSYLRSKLNVKR